MLFTLHLGILIFQCKGQNNSSQKHTFELDIWQKFNIRYAKGISKTKLKNMANGPRNIQVWRPLIYELHLFR